MQFANGLSNLTSGHCYQWTVADGGQTNVSQSYQSQCCCKTQSLSFSMNSLSACFSLTSSELFQWPIETNQTTNNFTNVISILRQIKLDVPALSECWCYQLFHFWFSLFLRMCQLAAPASTVFMALSASFSQANIFVAAAATATARHNQCYCVCVCVTVSKQLLLW